MSILGRLLNWVRCWWPVVAFAKWILAQRLALTSESIRRLALEKAGLRKQIRQIRNQQATVRAGLKREIRDVQKSRDRYRRCCKRLGKT